MRFLQSFCWTCDSHDAINPVKPFPVRPHILAMTRLWQFNKLLVIAKSRQMIQTWLFSALALWDALFHPGRLIMLQSKREEDAIGNENAGDGLMGRAKFILNHIPGRQILLPQYNPTKHALSKRVEFPWNNSTIWAIPQGAAIIRQRTASGILSDECGFQEEFADAYTASIPTIRGGGWFVALSTPDPGFYQLLYEDRVGDHH